jgi:hypothetical protein
MPEVWVTIWRTVIVGYGQKTRPAARTSLLMQIHDKSGSGDLLPGADSVHP